MQSISTREQFENAKKQEGIQVFLFTTKWCGDCIFIKPFMPQIEKKYESLTFYEIDRDVLMDVAVELEIMGIPSFVCYKEGKEISRFVSSLRKTREEIEAYLEQTMVKGEETC